MPAEPRPAASVLLVRSGASVPVEVYMIRRQQSMRFLGGYYAFPGGKVDPDDARPEIVARCTGLDSSDAARLLLSADGIPSLAFWIAAARELLEEAGVLIACGRDGRPVDASDPAVASAIERIRDALLAGTGPLDALLESPDWYLQLAPLRYLSHFVTPPSSPIRYTARFFLAPVPDGQQVLVGSHEASEGFWIAPAEGHRRFSLGEMKMAEPAYSALAYLSGFESLEALWAAHADGQPKFHGIVNRAPRMLGRAGGS
jgi:8-oxo-dGTP pyrophosphatase MutT (NUDIX family)